MGIISRFTTIIVLSLALMPTLYGAPINSPDYPEFEKIFNDWTDAFNHKDVKKSCALFSPKVTADYQGASQKNYDDICDGFKKIFAKVASYEYHFTLHSVYRADNLAVARITWYLKIMQGDKLLSTVQDVGIDIFKQDAQQQWKIINYIAYPTIKD